MSSKRIPKFTAVRVIVLVGLLLLVASFFAWWRLVYSHPTNVFDRMLANSLATPGVAKTIVQEDESQKLSQTTVLVTSPEQGVRSVSTLEEAGDTGSRVVTESLGTPKADYVRYREINTTQKNEQGQAYDFSQVLGVWGKTTDDNPASGNVQLFNQSVLGVVPVANVRQPLRASLLEQIKRDEVYKISGEVKRQLRNGRPVYTYKVAIDPVAYVKMLKSFASAIGLTQLEQVDPSQYENSPPLEFDFDVDVWSGQLTKITYGGSQRSESASGYGARLNIDEPTSSIGIDELQARLQQIQ